MNKKDAKCNDTNKGKTDKKRKMQEFKRSNCDGVNEKESIGY